MNKGPKDKATGLVWEINDHSGFVNARHVVEHLSVDVKVREPMGGVLVTLRFHEDAESAACCALVDAVLAHFKLRKL